MKYLKVDIEGPVIGSDSTEYVALDDGKTYSEEELIEIGQDAVNQVFTWGTSVVDESEVPESERDGVAS